MNNLLKILFSSIFAGILIALGACIYLALFSTAKIVGSLFFGIGLYLIIQFGLYLYTGKVGFLLDNKPSYIIDLLVCFFGNLIGIALVSVPVSFSRTGENLIPIAETIVEGKYNDSWWSVLILSIFCGVIIYLAVIGHRKVDNPVGRILSVFIPISMFILLGFEHVVANAAYFIIARKFDLKVLLWFVIMFFGNGIGSILLDLLFKAINYFEKKK